MAQSSLLFQSPCHPDSHMSNIATNASNVTGHSNQIQSNGAPHVAKSSDQRDRSEISPVTHHLDYQKNGLDSSLTRRYVHGPCRHRLDTSLARFSYSPASLFSPHLQSPLRNIHIQSSPRAGTSRSSKHRLLRSRIGLIPTVKFQQISTRHNTPSRRGYVRSVFSRDIIGKQKLPSTEQVLSSLRQKSVTGEKRTRDNLLDGHIVIDTHIYGHGDGEGAEEESSDLTDMNKKRKPNTAGADASLDPSTPSHPTQSSQQKRQRSDSKDTTPAAPSVSSRSSPRSAVRDGHRRTAVTSSLSSSLRNRQKNCSQKKKRDDYPSSLDGHNVTDTHRGGEGTRESSDLTDMNKRRNPNTAGADASLEPSTPSVSSRSSTRSSVRDGHLRTAMASSLSSSLRAGRMVSHHSVSPVTTTFV